MKMEPIYINLRNKILEKINTGEYKSGEKIPSERDLGQKYNVSRMTARQAINELVKDGVVTREIGRGTYVLAPQFMQKNVKSFTETLKEQGYESKTKVLEFSTVHSLKDISAIMGYNYKDRFYKIKRLRLGNDLPMALETVYIPTDKCEGLNNYEISSSLYKILKEIYGYEIERLSYDIDACIANKHMMQLFEVQKPIALLKVKGISYTISGDKLSYEESYYRSEIYKYNVDIYKRN